MGPRPAFSGSTSSTRATRSGAARRAPALRLRGLLGCSALDPGSERAAALRRELLQWFRPLTAAGAPRPRHADRRRGSATMRAHVGVRVRGRRPRPPRPVRDGLSLGRSSDNDVVLRDFSVSPPRARGAAGRGVHDRRLESTTASGSTRASCAPGPSPRDVVGIGSFELSVEHASTAEVSGLTSATYLRPLSEFNQDYGLEASRRRSRRRSARASGCSRSSPSRQGADPGRGARARSREGHGPGLRPPPGRPRFHRSLDEDGEPKLELNRVRESPTGARSRCRSRAPSSTWSRTSRSRS